MEKTDINTKSHYDWLDLAKGIGMILIVAGHGLFPLHYALDVFHVPLFFFLTGVTFHTPIRMEGFVIKKVWRIGIPYIFFSVLTSIPEAFGGCIMHHYGFWRVCL